MSRITLSDIEASLQAEHILFTVLATLDFASGAVRAHIGVGDLTIGGQTYLGTGEFSALSTITERPDGRDYTQLTVGLKGVSPTYLAQVPDRTDYFGRYASIQYVVFNRTTYLPVEPIEAAVFEGFMDFMSYERSAGSASIAVTIKHFDSIYAQSPDQWFTDEHQKALFASDAMFDQLAAMNDQEIIWGGGKVNSGATDVPPGAHPAWTPAWRTPYRP